MDERLKSAVDGIDLDEREIRYLEWLSRMDDETIEVFAGILGKKIPPPEGSGKCRG